VRCPEPSVAETPYEFVGLDDWREQLMRLELDVDVRSGGLASTTLTDRGGYQRGSAPAAIGPPTRCTEPPL
jgi:hypothetical protein